MAKWTRGKKVGRKTYKRWSKSYQKTDTPRARIMADERTANRFHKLGNTVLYRDRVNSFGKIRPDGSVSHPLQPITLNVRDIPAELLYYLRIYATMKPRLVVDEKGDKIGEIGGIKVRCSEQDPVPPFIRNIFTLQTWQAERRQGVDRWIGVVLINTSQYKLYMFKTSGKAYFLEEDAVAQMFRKSITYSSDTAGWIVQTSTWKRIKYVEEAPFPPTEQVLTE
jgi:hypothetical protein